MTTPYHIRYAETEDGQITHFGSFARKDEAIREGEKLAEMLVIAGKRPYVELKQTLERPIVIYRSVIYG